MTDKYETCPICGVEPRPYDRGQCRECDTLIGVLFQALSTARRVGVPKYGPSSWRDVSEREHLLHASEHITWWLIGSGSDKSSGEDHLSHAICRLAMAKAIQDA